MKIINLSNRQARRLLLAYHWLWPPYKGEGKAGILEYIQRVGCIQFDPLNIAGRNAELVLQARINGFRPDMLKELLYEERQLLDGWDKVMSIYHVKDWPFFRRLKKGARKWYGDKSRPALAILPEVRKELRKRGPLSSIDLRFDATVEWSWSATRIARAALESMYAWGELIVHHKVGTRKVYDFTKNHIPETILRTADPNRSEKQFYEWYVSRRIGGIGLLWNRAGDAWLGISGLKSKHRKDAINSLLKKKQLQEVHVEGIKHPLYIRSRDWEELHGVTEETAGKRRIQQAAIIAPLDNLIWDRRYLEELFGFVYRWEVYKPAIQRQYGYYVLPVLYGDRFIARFEPGRDKDSESLVINKWWWEPGVQPTKGMQAALHKCFKRFLRFLPAQGIQGDVDIMKKAGLEWLML